jgi:hypothetical protein
VKLSAGSDKLRLAMKTLTAQWDETKSDWRDVVRADYEEKHLVPLQEQTRALLTAIGLLAQSLEQAQRDCVE